MSGFGGHPILSTIERTKVYSMVGDDVDEKVKLASVTNKTKRETIDGFNGGVFVTIKGLLGPC